MDSILMLLYFLGVRRIPSQKCFNGKAFFMKETNLLLKYPNLGGKSRRMESVSHYLFVTLQSCVGVLLGFACTTKTGGISNKAKSSQARTTKACLQIAESSWNL
jgi:hypothetical protein